MPRVSTTIVSLVFSCTILLTAAQAQTYSVLYNFDSRSNGGYDPIAGVTMDRAGNLYGTTAYGGFGIGCHNGCGTAFKLHPAGSGWVLTPLYDFRGGSDGATPFARLLLGQDGSLYGTTFEGGNDGCSFGCGIVFNLRPPPRPSPTILGSWSETILHTFFGYNDGASPGGGDLLFDQAGNIYGTTTFGGGGFCPDTGCGTVYQLTHSGGSWTEAILHSFSQMRDAAEPFGGVVFNQLGNLYGTTLVGGESNQGAVYQLTPSGSGWSEDVLYNFKGFDDGQGLYGTPVFDQAGNLYATTCCSGPGGGGCVFQLVRSRGWVFNLIHSFSGTQVQGPESGMVMDAAGNFYGTTNQEGIYLHGSVFKLSPTNGGWTYTSLYDFCAGGLPCTDGASPAGILTLDSAGNLYGTTTQGGAYGGGTVWKIAP